ncbi:MAG: hypothetical protein FJ102_10030 [Deltaproteobacteria bacterium]|nr:hypothetical protein [Deltaproteobacteria bacterium]
MLSHVAAARAHLIARAAVSAELIRLRAQLSADLDRFDAFLGQLAAAPSA